MIVERDKISRHNAEQFYHVVCVCVCAKESQNDQVNYRLWTDGRTDGRGATLNAASSIDIIVLKRYKISCKQCLTQ